MSLRGTPKQAAPASSLQEDDIGTKLFSNLNLDVEPVDGILLGGIKKSRKRLNPMDTMPNKGGSGVDGDAYKAKAKAVWEKFSAAAASAPGGALQTVTDILSKIKGKADTNNDGTLNSDELKAALPKEVRDEYDETVNSFQQIFTEQNVAFETKMSELLRQPYNRSLRSDDEPEDSAIAPQDTRREQFVNAMLESHKGLNQTQHLLHVRPWSCPIEAIAACEDPIIAVLLYRSIPLPAANENNKVEKAQMAEDALKTCSAADRMAIEEGVALYRGRHWMMVRVKNWWRGAASNPNDPRNGINLDKWCKLMDRLLLRGDVEHMPLHMLIPRYEAAFISLDRALNKTPPRDGVVLLPRDLSMAERGGSAAGPAAIGAALGDLPSADVGEGFVQTKYGRVYSVSDYDSAGRVANAASYNTAYVGPSLRDKIARFFELCVRHLVASSANTNTDLERLVTIKLNQVWKVLPNERPDDFEGRLEFWKVVRGQMLADEWPQQDLVRLFAQSIRNIHKRAGTGQAPVGEPGKGVPSEAIAAWLNTHDQPMEDQRFLPRRPRFDGAKNGAQANKYKEDLNDMRATYMSFVECIVYATDWRPALGNDPEYSWFGTSAAAPVAFAAMQLAIGTEGDEDWVSPVAGSVSQNQLRQLASGELLANLRLMNPRDPNNNARGRRNNNDARRQRKAAVGNSKGWVSHLSKMKSAYEGMQIVNGVVPGSRYVNDLAVKWTVYATTHGMILMGLTYLEAVGGVVLSFITGAILGPAGWLPRAIVTPIVGVANMPILLASLWLMQMFAYTFLLLEGMLRIYQGRWNESYLYGIGVSLNRWRLWLFGLEQQVLDQNPDDD